MVAIFRWNMGLCVLATMATTGTEPGERKRNALPQARPGHSPDLVARRIEC
ncbi:MAG: hypothetical protein K0Q67_2399, partial [Cellvibrio sp.]|nr:hypothetical protein [Cellvibrio sp.]